MEQISKRRSRVARVWFEAWELRISGLDTWCTKMLLLENAYYFPPLVQPKKAFFLSPAVRPKSQCQCKKKKKPEWAQIKHQSPVKYFIHPKTFCPLGFLISHWCIAKYSFFYRNSFLLITGTKIFCVIVWMEFWEPLQVSHIVQRPRCRCFNLIWLIYKRALLWIYDHQLLLQCQSMSSPRLSGSHE